MDWFNTATRWGGLTGKFPKYPTTVHPAMAVMAVANATPPNGRPAACSTVGLTTRIYAIVMNVVVPARTSVATDEPRADSAKVRSSHCMFGRCERVARRHRARS